MYASDKDDINDLQQETVFNLWNTFPKLRKESKFSTWVYRIALNTYISDFIIFLIIMSIFIVGLRNSLINKVDLQCVFIYSDVEKTVKQIMLSNKKYKIVEFSKVIYIFEKLFNLINGIMKKKIIGIFLFLFYMGEIQAQYFDGNDAYNQGRADRMSIDAQRAMINKNYKKAYQLFSKSVEIRPTTMAYIGLMCILQSGRVYKYNNWAQSQAKQYYVKARSLDNMNMSNAYISKFYMIMLYPGFDPDAYYPSNNGNYDRSKSEIQRAMKNVRERISGIQEQRSKTNSAYAKIEYTRMEREMKECIYKLQQEAANSE